MIREEHAQGVRHIIFTPHYRPGMFTVSPTERVQAFRETVEQVQPLYPDMTFYLGCEVHVHKDILQTLQVPACRINDGLVVLLEYKTNGSFKELEQVVTSLVAEGYQPILAHAERYRCMYEGANRPALIRQAGALIQINAETFLERNRSPRKKFASALMEQGLVDFVASDAHDMHFRRVNIAECVGVIRKQFGEEACARVFHQNQEKIFQSQ